MCVNPFKSRWTGWPTIPFHLLSSQLLALLSLRSPIFWWTVAVAPCPAIFLNATRNFGREFFYPMTHCVGSLAKKVLQACSGTPGRYLYLAPGLAASFVWLTDFPPSHLQPSSSPLPLSPISQHPLSSVSYPMNPREFASRQSGRSPRRMSALLCPPRTAAHYLIETFEMLIYFFFQLQNHLDIAENSFEYVSIIYLLIFLIFGCLRVSTSVTRLSWANIFHDSFN